MFKKDFSKEEIKSRWWWFWGNEFYEATPLTGYSFINVAKTRVETIFWYGLLFTFLLITINNVGTAVEHYTSKPTRTTVSLSSKSSRTTVGLDNMTLVLEMSTFDMSSEVPFLLDNRRIFGVNDVPCINSEPSVIRNMIESQTNNLYNDNKTTSTIPSENDDNDSAKNWDTWYRDEIVPRTGLLSKFYDQYKNDAPEFTRYNYFQNVFEKEFQDKAEYFDRYLTLFRKILTPLHDGRTLNYLRHLKESQLLPDQTGTNLAQLYNLVVEKMKQVVYIEAGDAKTYLTSWEEMLEKKAQIVTYEIVLPVGIKRLDIKIYSTKMSYFLAILDAIANHLAQTEVVCKTCYDCKQLITCYDDLYCPVYDYKNATNLDSLPFHNENLRLSSRLFHVAYKTLEQHYKMTMHSTLKMPSTAVKLESMNKYEVNLIPSGRFVSKTDNCTSESIHECTDRCVNNIYLQKCDCFPWSLTYLNINKKGSEMCEQHCLVDDTEKEICEKTCDENEAHRCEAMLHVAQQITSPMEHGEFQKDHGDRKRILNFFVEKFSYKSELPIMRASIYLKDISTYPHFIKEYEMTIGTFMSTLGSLVDLWLGVNVVGLLHLLVYMIRQFRHAKDPHSKTGHTLRLLCNCRKKDKLEQENETEDPQKITQLYLLSNEITNQCKRLEEFKRKRMELELLQEKLLVEQGKKIEGSHTIDINIEKEQEEEQDDDDDDDDVVADGKWWWLRGNGFYKTTTLTGYILINEAKSLVEVIFWYVVLGSLTIVTIINVVSNVQTFIMKPTQVETSLLSNNSDASIKNFTLNLTRSLLEYSDHHSKHTTDWAPSQAILVYPCQLQSSQPSDEEMADIVHSLYADVLAGFRTKCTASSILIYTRTLMQLKDRMIEIFPGNKSFLSLLNQYYSTELQAVLDEFRQASSSYQNTSHIKGYHSNMEERSQKLYDISSVLNELMLPSFLASILIFPKFESLWQQKNLTKETCLENGLDSLQNNGITLDDLYEMQSAWLAGLVVPTNAQIYTHSSSLTKTSHELELEVFVSKNVTEVNIDVYSNYLSIFLSTLHVVNEHLVKLVQMEHTLHREGKQCAACINLYYCCPDGCPNDRIEPSFAGREMIERLYDMFASIRNHLLEQTAAHIILDDTIIQLKPFQTYELELLPTGSFKSEIAGCYEGSSTEQECVDRMLLEKSLKTCNCWPWFLGFYGSKLNEPMCTEPCMIDTEECKIKCQYDTAHPCKTKLYRVDKRSKPIKHFYPGSDNNYMIHPEKPIMSINLKMRKSYNFPKFVEMYQLDNQNFISQLGGTLELYLGINIISLVHLVIYMIRQCRHLPDKHSKTGITIRRILGMAREKKKETKEAEVLEEDSDIESLRRVLRQQSEMIERMEKDASFAEEQNVRLQELLF